MAAQIFNWNAKWQISRWLLIVYAVSLLGSSLGNEQTFMEADNVCSCPNDMLSYNCTVVGGVATVWEGSVFDCPTGGIVLRHSEFSGGTFGSCNDGAIVGRSVGFVDNCYSSRLDITLNLEMNNKTIQCQGVNRVGRATLSVISVVPPISVSLTGVNQGNLTFNWTLASTSCPLSYQISFDCGSCPSMTQATSTTCSDLQLSAIERLCTFRIQSVCRRFVGNQNKSVGVMLKAPDIPDAKITPIYNAKTQILSRIDFEIQEEAPFTITNGVLSSIESYNISFCCDDDDMINSSIQNLPSNGVIKFQLSNCRRNNVSVYISAISRIGEGQSSYPYTTGCNNTFVVVRYNSDSASISCMFLNKSDTSNKSCNVVYGQCNELKNNNTEYGISDTISVILNIDRFQSYCYEVTASSYIYTVTVEGKIAGIGGRGTVSVVAVVIPLVFILVIVTVLGVLLATLSYYLCLRRNPKGTASMKVERRPLSDEIELILPPAVETTLPAVPFSSTKVTEGSPTGVSYTQATATTTNAPPNALSTKVSADAPPTENGCTVPITPLPSSITGDSPPNITQPTDSGLPSAAPPDDVSTTSTVVQKITNKILMLIQWQPNLKKIMDHNFEIRNVDEDCELRECVGKTFKRGCAYYEICPEGETVFEDQELIFVKDNEYYRPPDDYKDQLHQGKEVKPSTDYRVFIQCIGSGARYLHKNSTILAHKGMNDEQPYDVEKLSWRRVISDQFNVLKVRDDVALSTFLENIPVTSAEVGNIFLEYDTFYREGGGKIIDVVLMPKAPKREYFTGPKARYMVQQYYQLKRKSDGNQHKDPLGEDDTEFEIIDKLDAVFLEWKVFVLTKLKGEIQLRAKEEILCQSQYATVSTFVCLEVDEDNVQMRKFVEQELHEFENGNAFYKLPKEGEDLLYYKDVLLPPALNDKKPGEKLLLKMNIRRYYALGAPGEKIKPSGKNIFVQSNSSGSRCLKKGAKILYKIIEKTHKDRPY